jgi:outer membrane protein assembly factor BamD
MITTVLNFLKKHVVLVAGSMILVIASSCAKEQKKESMSFDELTTKASQYAKTKKHEDAIAYLDEALSRFGDHEKIHQVKIDLAEEQFDNGNYPVAQELYEHFNQFYPADARAEYAKYKSILSMYRQTLDVHCDQSETEDTIKLCREYLQNAAYKKFHKEINDIQKLSENKLFNKEVYVFDFYFRRGKYDAARYRLKTLKNKFAPSLGAYEDQLLYLECKLAQKEKNKKLIRHNIDELLKKYPTSEFTLMAQGLTAKRPFIF